MTPRLAIIVALGCSGFSATSLADQERQDQATAAARSIHADGDYPDSLSLVPEPEEPPDWLRQLNEAIAAFFEAIGPLLEVALYLLLAVGAVYLIARLVEYVGEPRSQAEVATPTFPAETRRVVEPSVPDEDPDALAARGHYDRAIYFLLLRALKRVGWGGAPGDASLTAREVAGAIAEGDPRCPPLRDLVALTEPIRFGGVTAETRLYERARRHYLELCEAA